MAISLRDFLTFPFNSGRGIRMNQIDGAQLHFVSSSWDDAADPTHLILSPFLDNVPEQALFFFRLPGTIPRKARQLTARIGVTNIERPLVGIDGSAIPTRLLAPNYLYGTLMDSAAARLIEPLFPRPQDFNIVVARVYAPYATIDSDLTAGTRYATRDVVSPPYATGETPDAGFLVGPTHNFIVFGVPVDAPDIADVQPLDHTIHPSGSVQEYTAVRASAVTTEIDGVPHKWWSGGPWIEDRTFRVTFEAYS